MESSILELEKNQNQKYDSLKNIIYINLNHYLISSYKEYKLYISQHNLKLLKTEKNKLGLHFISKKIFEISSENNITKYFYYQYSQDFQDEFRLVKRFFNSLSTRFKYGEDNFLDFLKNEDFNPLREIDKSKVNFSKFRQFLKRNDLQQLEQQFKDNVNIKLSLLP